MAAIGATHVVSGFGNKITAVGGGRVIAAATNGTAVPDRMGTVLIIHRIAHFGPYHARMVVAVTMNASRPSGVTAVTMV